MCPFLTFPIIILYFFIYPLFTRSVWLLFKLSTALSNNKSNKSTIEVLQRLFESNIHHNIFILHFVCSLLRKMTYSIIRGQNYKAIFMGTITTHTRILNFPTHGVVQNGLRNTTSLTQSVLRMDCGVTCSAPYIGSAVACLTNNELWKVVSAKL